MSSADVIGSLAALERTVVRVKVVRKVTGTKGVLCLPVADCDNVHSLAKSRGEVQLEGEVVATFVCPPSADFVASAAAAIVPVDCGLWPSDVDQVAEAPGAVNFATSAVAGTANITLPLDPAINRVLKPVPVVGRQPCFLLGWSVETTKKDFSARFELSFQLRLTGVDWVRPASWKSSPKS